MNINSAATEKLTPRECEIIALTAHGNTRGEIATQLSIAQTTVKEHIERACRKLNARNKTHASSLSIVHGLIDTRRLKHHYSYKKIRQVLQTEDAHD